MTEGMKRINVTQTFLPELAEYTALLQRAWDKKWITNRGELVLELEEKLRHYLGVPHIALCTNGTIPLQIGVRLLAGEGEVITTPFSYVATTSSLVWEHCTPVFVDIEHDHLTLDASKIEAAITPRTRAILATHVFGNPCDVDAIESIAKKHRLHVIYDAAHAFGVKYKGKSLFAYGDMSTASFHATKIFHCGEGGAMFCANQELHDMAVWSNNFGHNGPEAFHGVGINGKMSELQAAMGLSVLGHMDYIFDSRRRVVEQYTSAFRNHPSFTLMTLRSGTDWNYSYFPVICESESHLLGIVQRLNAEHIFPRRYFYPSLNTLNYVEYQSMPVSESISSRILCLPLYAGLEEEEVERIIALTKG
jgi:dTDP-4-amino-4,6-dideoxygalactose transaminase